MRLLDVINSEEILFGGVLAIVIVLIPLLICLFVVRKLWKKHKKKIEEKNGKHDF